MGSLWSRDRGEDWKEQGFGKSKRIAVNDLLYELNKKGYMGVFKSEHGEFIININDHGRFRVEFDRDHEFFVATVGDILEEDEFAIL